MTLTHVASITISHFLLLITILSLSLECAVLVTALGSASTVAVTFRTPTVCGIIAGEPTQRIQCYQNGLNIPVSPNISFEAISGGRTFFCGLRTGGFSILCWDTPSNNDSTSLIRAKRIYFNYNVSLTDLSVGDDQVCAREVVSGIARCWRGRGGSPFLSPGARLKFRSITSGSGFTCGILKNDGKVFCWGGNEIGVEIQRQFGNLSMSNLVAGDSHACGLTRTGFLVCKGNNEDLPSISSSAFEFSGLSLGGNFGCGIKQRKGFVLCWNRSEYDYNTNAVKDISFESIVAGLNFICGLTTRNLKIICWGPGWSNGANNSTSDLPLGVVIPGPCVQASCNCGTYLNSGTLCHGSGNICKLCQTELPIAVPLTPVLAPPFSPQRKGISRVILAFFIVGSAGIFAGICTIAYCLWEGGYGRFLLCRTNSSVEPTVNVVNNNDDFIASHLRSVSIRRNSSRRLGRQRSGSSLSSSKHPDKTENFSLLELANATNNFSVENMIGAGSFGVVYKGKLPGDGREVAIKRGDHKTSAGGRVKKFQEKETAFDSEIALLSRLHHKHLVGLVGFCQENDERVLVYEYMSNGSLYDHLHNKYNISRVLNSWKMRIKIALDAARGIEYLHNYAVPPIIHRDIKSSNILLDSNWTARVSDFGLSLMGAESDQEFFMSTRAVGTVGYIDPEYYVSNVLTAKSDVYGFGVVMLELLTGKKAIFKIEDGTLAIGVVDYARPKILADDLWTVVDTRVGVPTEIHESEAVEMMAYTALHCVNLEGKERPTVTDIVANLEKALALCDI